MFSLQAILVNRKGERTFIEEGANDLGNKQKFCIANANTNAEKRLKKLVKL